MAGLTESGYVANTAGEWFEFSQEQFEQIAADLGKSAPRWLPFEFVTVVFTVFAQALSEAEGVIPNLFDAFSPTQASGQLLRDLADFVGVPYSDGSRSTVTLTVGAWDSGDVLLSAGKLSSDGVNKWETTEDVVIPSGSTTSVEAQAVDTGAIEASAGTITRRVDSVAGWVSVTNAAEANVGIQAEDDAIIRARIARGQGSNGSASPHAVEAAISRVSGVEAARVVFNSSLADDTVSSRTIPGNGVGVWVAPDSITDGQKLEILRVMYATITGNVPRSLPSTTGASGVLGEIEGTNGQAFQEGFWYMVDEEYRVRIKIDPADGYEPGGTLAGVSDPLTSAVEEFFDGLNAGDVLRQQDLLGQLVLVEGVARIDTLEFAPDPFSSYSTADVTPDAATRIILESVVVEEV